MGGEEGATEDKKKRGKNAPQEPAGGERPERNLAKRRVPEKRDGNEPGGRTCRKAVMPVRRGSEGASGEPGPNRRPGQEDRKKKWRVGGGEARRRPECQESN